MKHPIGRRSAHCQDNHLSLNVSKTKKLIVDHRKGGGGEHAPIHNDGAAVEQVESFKFLVVKITKDLQWSTHPHTVVKMLRRLLEWRRRRRQTFYVPPTDCVFC